MSDNARVPEVMLVRALTASPPFEAGDVLSIAFNDAAVGRLEPHERRTPAPRLTTDARLVPEAITVCVLTDAPPYSPGVTVTLSFVDPRFARMHATSPTSYASSTSPASPTLQVSLAPAERPRERAESSPDAGERGVALGIDWTFERARRFVNVIDKLFTIDRLGAYRHVLAMRLLVPDTIACDDPATTIELARRLQSLRSAVAETLGRPLLAAFMPAFAIEREWIDAIESAAVERAALDVRSAIAAHAFDASRTAAERPTATTSVCTLSARAFDRDAAPTSAGIIARLIPPLALDPTFSAHLSDYRSTLVAAFAAAPASGALPADRSPSILRALDEQLWNVAGTAGAIFGGVAAG